ncbi:MAG: biopolymer transporter ExbD [Bdellovibrio sp.]
MAISTVLGHSAQGSVLGSNSILNPQGSRTKRNILADLLLTALIDAFSILVIFLLMSFSSSGELLMIDKDQQLPSSTQAEALERFPVIKVEDSKIFLEGAELTGDQLTGALLELRKKHREMHPELEFQDVITIQADRRMISLRI